MEYPTGFDQERLKHKPICGVLAMAIVCEVTYDVAHAACKAALFELFPYRKRFGGGTNLRINDLVMSRLAVKFERHNVKGMLRLHDWVRRYTKPDVNYLVRTPGHIMTVRNHCVIDQVRSCNFLLRANRKVTHWYEIKGKGW